MTLPTTLRYDPDGNVLPDTYCARCGYEWPWLLLPGGCTHCGCRVTRTIPETTPDPPPPCVQIHPPPTRLQQATAIAAHILRTVGLHRPAHWLTNRTAYTATSTITSFGNIHYTAPDEIEPP